MSNKTDNDPAPQFDDDEIPVSGSGAPSAQTKTPSSQAFAPPPPSAFRNEDEHRNEDREEEEEGRAEEEEDETTPPEPQPEARAQFLSAMTAADKLLRMSYADYAKRPALERKVTIRAVEDHIGASYLAAEENSAAAEFVAHLKESQEHALVYSAVGVSIATGQFRDATNDELQSAAKALTSLLDHGKFPLTGKMVDALGMAIIGEFKNRQKAAPKAEAKEREEFVVAGAAAAVGGAKIEPTPATTIPESSPVSPEEPKLVVDPKVVTAAEPPPPTTNAIAETQKMSQRRVEVPWFSVAVIAFICIGIPIIWMVIHFFTEDEAASTNVSASVTEAPVPPAHPVAPVAEPPHAPHVPAAPPEHVRPPVADPAPPPAPIQWECNAAVPGTCERYHLHPLNGDESHWNCEGAQIIHYTVDDTYNLCECRWCEPTQ